MNRFDGFARDDQGRLALPSHILDRFWAKVDRSGGPAACWPWTGCGESSGYGIFVLITGKHPLQVRAHILAFEIQVGPVPAGELVRHYECDVRRCCNGSHLRAGTPRQNMQDRKRKGRYAIDLVGRSNPMNRYPASRAAGKRNGSYTHPECRPSGERHGMSKLTDIQRADIRRRRAAGELTTPLAVEYGVGRTTIQQVVRGRKRESKCENYPLVSAEDALAAKFWSKVDKSQDCWLWTGTKDQCGYGIFFVNRKQKRAHRVAFEMEEGPLPPGVKVRHVQCDNRACCRRSHLAPGTQAQNMADMVAKGRRVWARGEQASLAKLTDEDVVQILNRVAAGDDRTDIAAEFNIHRGSIKELVSGRNRGYLPLDELRGACRVAALQKAAEGRAKRWVNR